MRAKRVSRKEWSSTLEQSSLDRDEEKQVAALAAFSGLEEAEKMRLALEIAETRAPEITLAYENVVAVMAGYKKVGRWKRDRKWDRSPCVILVVRNKWRPGTNKHSGQRLPYCLLAYAGTDKARGLCAVPTDVIPEKDFFGARSQAAGPSGLAVLGGEGERGNACCRVALRGPHQARLLMSCHHVLSPLRQVGAPAPDPGAPVQNLLTRKPIGNAIPLGGYLHAASGPTSLDVQFAEVYTPEQAAQAALAVQGLVLSGMTHISSRAIFMTLPRQTLYRIHVSPTNNSHANNGPLPARMAGFADGQPIVEYKFWKGSKPEYYYVKHAELLVFEVLNGKRTLPGDSGSVIFCTGPDGGMTIVGMHIGGGQGSDFPVSFAIPAWKLFEPAAYGLPPGSSLTPV